MCVPLYSLWVKTIQAFYGAKLHWCSTTDRTVFALFMTSCIVRNQYVKYSIKDLIQLLYYQYYTIRFTIDILLIVSKASPQCSCLRQICTSCPHTTDILLCWQCSSHSLRSGNTAHLYCLKMENTDKFKKNISTSVQRHQVTAFFPPNLYCYCLNKVYGQ